ncbi:MAG TPA: PHP domain-containing protein [Vicinamibacterales bacterium]|nr:PHP domain-containing protein [Vicinamibacterales bacterium]
MTDAAISRADLHVHSWHSRVNGDLPFVRSRDCYSSPLEVYRVAKRRGMGIVTITDHDSIAGCRELLEAHPGATDILAAEEVSCRFPEGDIEVHLGVYGMTERLHDEIQPARRDVFEAIALLRSAGVFFALNHLLHFYRRQAPMASYLRLLSAVPAIEVRNGTMLEMHNSLVERFRREWASSPRPLAVVAGSDAHTLRRVGRTWTEAPGATAREFLASLGAGLGRAGGRHGGARAVAGDAYGVIRRYGESVLGFGPRDHAGLHRAMCAALIFASVPFQFLPAAIVAVGKSRERRTVAAALEWLAAAADRGLPMSAPAPEPRS